VDPDAPGLLVDPVQAVLDRRVTDQDLLVIQVGRNGADPCTTRLGLNDLVVVENHPGVRERAVVPGEEPVTGPHRRAAHAAPHGEPESAGFEVAGVVDPGTTHLKHFHGLSADRGHPRAAPARSRITANGTAGTSSSSLTYRIDVSM
jgi:hypothetical protein